MKTLRDIILETVMNFPSQFEPVKISKTDLEKHPPKGGRALNVGDDVSQLGENKRRDTIFHYGKVVYHDNKNAMVKWEDGTFSLHSRSGDYKRWHKHASGRPIVVEDRFGPPKKCELGKEAHQKEKEGYLIHSRAGVDNIAAQHVYDILSKAGLPTNKPEKFGTFHRINVNDQDHRPIHDALISGGFERLKNYQSSFDHRYIKHIDNVPFIVDFKDNSLLSKQRPETLEDSIRGLYVPDYDQPNPSKVPGWRNNSIEIYMHKAGFKHSKLYK